MIMEIEQSTIERGMSNWIINAAASLHMQCLGLEKVKVVDFLLRYVQAHDQDEKQQTHAVKVSSTRGYIK
jgi:putative lipoic acid-binding regulatory protein